MACSENMIMYVREMLARGENWFSTRSRLWHNPSFLHLTGLRWRKCRSEGCSCISCTLYLQFFLIISPLYWNLWRMLGTLTLVYSVINRTERRCIHSFVKAIASVIWAHWFGTKGDDGCRADMSLHSFITWGTGVSECLRKQPLNTVSAPEWFTYYI